MTEQTRKRQCAQAFMFSVHRERQFAHAQCITSFVVTGLIQRRLKANHDAILAQHKLVSAHPATVCAENLMVRGTDQRAPILQHKRDALSLALNHHFSLHRCA